MRSTNCLKKIRLISCLSRKTARLKACQIDILIETKHAIFIGEIKCRKKIGLEIIKEVQNKIERICVPSGKSVRPFLVVEGAISNETQKSGYFDRILTFSDMLTMPPIEELR